MIDHNHFICHFIFGGHLLNIPKNKRFCPTADIFTNTITVLIYYYEKHLYNMFNRRIVLEKIYI